MSEFVRLDELLRQAQDEVWKSSPKLGMASFWEQAAGAEVAARARVRGFSGGILTVECDSGGWACELRLAAADLTARLNSLGPPEQVTEIRFVHQAQGGWKSRK